MKLTDITEVKSVFIKAVFYGEPGSGKTTLVGSTCLVPDLYPMLILNCVGNPISIRNIRPKPYVIDLDDIDDLNVIYKWLLDGQDSKHPIPTSHKKKYNEDMPIFKTVVIDQLTGVNGMFMRQRLGMKKITDHKKAEFDDWGGLLQFNEAIGYNFFYTLPMHVIMTAQEKVEIDQLTQEKSWGVGIYGQGQQVLPSYAYLVARLVRMNRIKPQAVKEYKISEDTYTVAFFDQIGRFSAKDQYTLPFKHLEEPTMKVIWDAVKQSTLGRSEEPKVSDEPEKEKK